MRRMAGHAPSVCFVFVLAFAAPAGADDAVMLGRPGAEPVGQAKLICPADDTAQLRLFDRYGGELGSATVDGCPRLSVPVPLDGAGGGAALVVAADDKKISLLAAVTPGGGMVLPVDLPGVTVQAAETDGEGQVLSITIGRETPDGKGESKLCRLTDVPSSLACIDGF